MSILDIFGKRKRHDQVEDRTLQELHESTCSPVINQKASNLSMESLNEAHYKLLRRLKNHPVNEAFSGIMTLELDVPSCIEFFIQKDLIRIGNVSECLECLKVECLKNILCEHKMKISGTKNELIARIITGTSHENIKQSKFYKEVYVLTPVAIGLIDESYLKFDQINTSFFKDMTDLIMAGDLDSAYRLICKKNSEKPIPPGIGCDWVEWSERGLYEIDKKLYANSLKRNADKGAAACAIYHDMSGNTINVNVTNKVFRNVSKDDIRYENSIISTERQLYDLVQSGEDKYRFVSALDDRTCSICGELDEKSFNVSDARIGKNCPPMHKGCRCGIVMSDTEWMKDSKRAARDPSTKKSMYVPAGMTYNQWKKKYMK